MGRLKKRDRKNKSVPWVSVCNGQVLKNPLGELALVISQYLSDNKRWCVLLMYGSIVQTEAIFYSPLTRNTSFIGWRLVKNV